MALHITSRVIRLRNAALLSPIPKHISIMYPTPAPATRRVALQQLTACIAAAPLLYVPKVAMAAINAPLRKQLQYQDTPRDDKRCASCLEFMPGKTDSSPGTCKVIPNDDDISPNGYCTAWNTL